MCVCVQHFLVFSSELLVFLCVCVCVLMQHLLVFSSELLVFHCVCVCVCVCVFYGSEMTKVVLFVSSGI